MKALRNKVLGFILALAMIVPTQAQEAKKKRWTPKVKGYAIGAGAGAAAGAVIHKRNRWVGGAVGAAAGAAAGYAIGNSIEKRNARIAAAREAAEQRELASYNRPSSITKRSNERSAVSRRAANRVAAVRPQNTFTEPVDPMAALVRNGYLLNPSYGDSSDPYGMSEYRRKSW